MIFTFFVFFFLHSFSPGVEIGNQSMSITAWLSILRLWLYFCNFFNIICALLGFEFIGGFFEFILICNFFSHSSLDSHFPRFPSYQVVIQWKILCFSDIAPFSAFHVMSLMNVIWNLILKINWYGWEESNKHIWIITYNCL